MRSMPPSWSNMVASFAVTSSSYDAHFAIATGAAGALGAALSKGAAAMAAISSLRVIDISIQAQRGADRNPVHIHAAPFLCFVDFQVALDAFRRQQTRVAKLSQEMHGHGFDRIIRIVDEVNHDLVTVVAGEQVRQHGRDVE